MGRKRRVQGPSGEQEGGALSAPRPALDEVVAIAGKVATLGYGGGFPNDHVKRHYIDFLMRSVMKMSEDEFRFLKNWFGEDA